MASTTNVASAKYVGSVDFSQFPVEAFTDLALAVNPYRDRANVWATGGIDTVINVFALYTYKACWFIDRYQGSKKWNAKKLQGHVRDNWAAIMNHDRWFPIDSETREYLRKLEMHHFYEAIAPTALRVSVGLSSIPRTAELWSPPITQFLVGARGWLLACVQCPGIQLTPARLQQVQEYAVDVENVQQERLAGRLGLWPDLTRVLEALIPAPGEEYSATHVNDIYAAIMFFLQLAHTAFTSTNALIARERYTVHNQYIEEIILDASWPRPIFSEMDLHRQLCDVDPSGRLKARLSEKFDLSWLESVLWNWKDGRTKRLGFLVDLKDFCIPSKMQPWNRSAAEQAAIKARHHAARRTLKHRNPYNDHLLPRQSAARSWWEYQLLPDDDARADFDLTPSLATLSGRLQRCMRPIVDLSEDDECGTCRMDFDEEAPGFTPSVCQHTYHTECLASWYSCQLKQNAGEATGICCLCTQVVCSREELLVGRYTGFEIPLGVLWFNRDGRYPVIRWLNTSKDVFLCAPS